jgi:hypothetical protein
MVALPGYPRSTLFAVQLGSVPLTLAPSLKQIVFIRIKLAGPQWSWRRQWWLWSLPEILAHCIASQTKLFPDLA